MNNAKQKATELFQENYMILMEYSEKLSEEIVISLLSIKFGVKQCEDMINQYNEGKFNYKILDDIEVEYWEEVKQYLLEM